eukprot:TRINITY_DN37892_c0_g1_i1.p1 TRINITY_DN37892_c0_g1~~TRINITY_DN37892_c0_g1_i1.p1  ORF type:complete len:834 (-),score=165.87 TRINITY_DN37892_c0_g1_i1:132-2582(-)
MVDAASAEGSGQRNALLLGGVGVAALWWVKRRFERPYSYPGDAIPLKKRNSRQPRFAAGARQRVQAGWRPRPERQPAGDLLPHKVAGQQVWDFDASAADEAEDFDPASNPNNGDKIFRAARLKAWKGPRPKESEVPSGALEACRKGFAFYQMLQCDDGQWAGDYGGPHFLLPGFIIAAYITGGLAKVLPEPYWRAAEAYLRNHQQEDGGWGTHLESPSTMFCSVLNYVALRLVGVAADDPAAVQGRAFIHSHGGALYTAPWTKFWLAFLGVYDLRGIAPVPPELWLLPQWFPLHPGRFWCHCRMVYLPMCYLYGRRFAYDAAADPVTAALRRELYPPGVEYDKIPWGEHMFSIADMDNYSPVHWLMKVMEKAFAVYEWTIGPISFLRDRSLRFVEEYMRAEDIETNYLTIGPVSKAFHIVTSWVAAGGAGDPARAGENREYLAHLARVPAYLWIAEDGLKVQGYNGSMAWDTSFALQGAVEAGLQKEFPEMCAKAWGFLAREQVQALPEGDWRHWRQAIRGGWGFSTAEQAWPVSDTTAEAFKAVLALRLDGCVADRRAAFSDQSCFDAVEFLLSYQNADGGWATYENNRGWAWYEILNPACVFGNIMIDYSYVECSSSAMQALVQFRAQFPDHRSREIAASVERGARFIEAMQRSDGSWYGCWGNCFTYGCWFGIEGLVCAGRNPSSSAAIQKCVHFLLGKQNSDGGWGEDFNSCFNREYSTRDKLYGCDSGSSVVCTAWALLALMAADCPNCFAVKRGIVFLMKRQLPSGDWAQENISGVFNRSVGITYTAFRNVFPLWALGRCARNYKPLERM